MSKKHEVTGSVRERLIILSQSSEERSKLCKELCQHLSEGYSIESFSKVPTKVLMELLNSYKDEFNWEEIECAAQRGRDGWERIGRRQAEGQCLGNSRSWILNMINRYRWVERVDVSVEHKGSVQVQVVSYAPPTQSVEA